MKQFLLIFLLLLSVCNVYSQQDSCRISISGQVLDVETKEPIPFASVKVSGEDIFTVTNLQGEFKIDHLCSEENNLIISCFGYSDSISHHHHHDHENAPHFYLTQKVHEISTVEVQAEQWREEGTKSMAQITISRDQIKNNPTQSLASAMANANGVTLASTGTNVQIPIIHGLYGNRILIVNNGLKHGFQNWSKDHAPEIEVSSAGSLTVLKGASGVRFGPEALGGAIIVEPNALYLNQPLFANVGTSYQTNGRGGSTNMETGQGFKRWSYHINGSYTQIGDRKSPDYVLTNTGKQEKSIGLGTMYHHNKLDVKFHYSFVDQNLALLRASVAESGSAFIRAINSDEPIFVKPFSYEIGEPNQLTQHHFGKAEVNWYYSDHARFIFRVGRQLNYREEYDVRRNAEKPIIDLDLITSDYQIEWKHEEWFKLDGRIGLQYFKQENRNNPGTGTTAFIPNYTSDRYSAFIIESKRFKQKNVFELGLRLDFENNDVAGRETSQAIFRDNYQFNNLTASIGYVREISEHTLFRTNLGTAWRVPNMAELYSFGQRGFRSSYGLLRYYTNEEQRLFTNRVLELEQSDIEVEKGYKWINELEINQISNRHSITLYAHFIENFIFERPLAIIGTIRGPMPAFIFDQANAVFAGIDYSWRREWSSKVIGTLGVSYLWSKNISKNEVLINQPPAQLNYKLNYDLPVFWKLNHSKISFQPLYVFKQFQAPRGISPESIIDGSEQITLESEIFDFYDAPNGYFLFNVYWRFNWKRFGGSIGIENLFNTQYRDYLNQMSYFADDLGRNVLVTFNYSFKKKAKK